MFISEPEQHHRKDGIFKKDIAAKVGTETSEYTADVFSDIIRHLCKASLALLLLPHSAPPKLASISSTMYTPFTLVLRILVLFVIPLVKLRNLSPLYTSQLTGNIS